MIYVFDIDGTICSISGGDYQSATPFYGRIKKNNLLYDEGNMITYFTARGMGRTNNNQEVASEIMYETTRSQLEKWGVKYHQLLLGKPSGDIYVDDKGTNAEDFYGD